MSEAFQIGPFLLKMSTLAVIVSVALGFVAISAQLKNRKEVRSAIIELLSNALVLAFLVWKFSYVLFDFTKAIENPSSILYFSGGENGVVLAVVAVVVYLTMTVRKKAIPVQMVAIAIASGYLAAMLVYHSLSNVLDGENFWWFHFQQAAICLLFYWWISRVKERLVQLAAWLPLVMWFAISQVYVQFYVTTREAVLFGLSKEQLAYYGFALLLLFLSRRVKTESEEATNEVQ